MTQGRPDETDTPEMNVLTSAGTRYRGRLYFVVLGGRTPQSHPTQKPIFTRMLEERKYSPLFTALRRRVPYPQDAPLRSAGGTESLHR